MHVRKAVITAAGPCGTHPFAASPVQRAMLPLVDRDGVAKPVIQIIAEEALDSGIEEMCLVTGPGDEASYRGFFQAAQTDTPSTQSGRLAEVARHLHFVEQARPEGYGHAVWCAREFVGAEPFLLLVSDHLYISSEERRCARQVIDLAAQEGCAVAAVQATREHRIHHYGTVAGRRLPGRPNVFQIERIVEKPTPSLAEQELHVPGLRVGHYLCFFGIHVLTPAVFDLLDEHMRDERREQGSVQLTPALQELARREQYLAVQANGRRHDVGVRFGPLEAQLAMAMAGADRDYVLARLMELLLQFEQEREPSGPQDR